MMSAVARTMTRVCIRIRIRGRILAFVVALPILSRHHRALTRVVSRLVVRSRSLCRGAVSAQHAGLHRDDLYATNVDRLAISKLLLEPPLLCLLPTQLLPRSPRFVPVDDQLALLLSDEQLGGILRTPRPSFPLLRLEALGSLIVNRKG